MRITFVIKPLEEENMFSRWALVPDKKINKCTWSIHNNSEGFSILKVGRYPLGVTFVSGMDSLAFLYSQSWLVPRHTLPQPPAGLGGVWSRGGEGENGRKGVTQRSVSLTINFNVPLRYFELDSIIRLMRGIGKWIFKLSLLMKW